MVPRKAFQSSRTAEGAAVPWISDRAEGLAVPSRRGWGREQREQEGRDVGVCVGAEGAEGAASVGEGKEIQRLWEGYPERAVPSLLALGVTGSELSF